MAATRGKNIEHRLISAGGASLRRHWNGGEAPKAIKDGHYDYVVLQEQSTLPIKNAKRMHENVRLFDGGAWQSFLRKHDQPILHDRDQSHPTLAGSYLGACVFFAVLFKESPVGIDGEITGVTEKALVLLQKTAWQVCKSITRSKERKC